MASNDGLDHPTGAIRFKEVSPNDDWFKEESPGDVRFLDWSSIPPHQRHPTDRARHSLYEQERKLRASECSEVLYFDFVKLSESWDLEAPKVVDPVIRWTERYTSALRSSPEEIPPAYLAIGEKTRARDRRRLNASGIHHLDLSRGSLRRLAVGDTRQAKVGHLLESVFSTFTLPGVLPYPMQATSSTPPSGPPSSISSLWDAYYTAPAHIPSKDVDHLWDKLAGDLGKWERDS